MGAGYSELEERFVKVYSSLPLSERDLPVVVIDDEPISWARVYKEVQGKTDLAAAALKKLASENII